MNVNNQAIFHHDFFYNKIWIILIIINYLETIIPEAPEWYARRASSAVYIPFKINGNLDNDINSFNEFQSTVGSKN